MPTAHVSGLSPGHVQAVRVWLATEPSRKAQALTSFLVLFLFFPPLTS